LPRTGSRAREGVIHRDLKPQNIMLDANGRAYVMDFGIARSAYLPGMTQTGALVGTPEYMSPEQAKGEKLGERSDLFSLGVILYELVIGQSPYYSDTRWRHFGNACKKKRSRFARSIHDSKGI